MRRSSVSAVLSWLSFNQKKISRSAFLLTGMSFLIVVLFWCQGSKNTWVNLPFINRNASNAVFLDGALYFLSEEREVFRFEDNLVEKLTTGTSAYFMQENLGELYFYAWGERSYVKLNNDGSLEVIYKLEDETDTPFFTFMNGENLFLLSGRTTKVNTANGNVIDYPLKGAPFCGSIVSGVAYYANHNAQTLISENLSSGEQEVVLHGFSNSPFAIIRNSVYSADPSGGIRIIDIKTEKEEHLSVSGIATTSKYTIWGAINDSLYFSANNHLYKHSKGPTTKILMDVRLSSCVITDEYIVVKTSRELESAEIVKSYSVNENYANDDENVYSKTYTYAINQKTNEIVLLLTEEHELRV